MISFIIQKKTIVTYTKRNNEGEIDMKKCSECGANCHQTNDMTGAG